MIVDHREYRFFHYKQEPSDDDKFVLGEVVFCEEDGMYDVGVILQCHGNDNYRTDAGGNCSGDKLTRATQNQIMRFRPEIIKQ